jgi:hypothetical protein
MIEGSFQFPLISKTENQGTSKYIYYRIKRYLKVQMQYITKHIAHCQITHNKGLDNRKNRERYLLSRDFGVLGEGGFITFMLLT